MGQRVVHADHGVEAPEIECAQVGHRGADGEPARGCLPRAACDRGRAEVACRDGEARSRQPERLRADAACGVEDGLRIAQERGQHLGLTIDRALPVLEDQVVVRRQIVVEGVRLHVRNRTRAGTRPGVRRIIPAAALVIAACLATAGSAGAQSGACPKLSQPWYGSNAQRIQTVIDARGTCSGLPGGRPLAVFDWDNTIIKNDISDQTFFWMLRHDKVRQPAGRDWTTTSTYMTRAGARALRRACGSLADPGSRCRPARTRAAPTSSSRSARTRRRRAATPRSPATTIAAWRARTSGCPSSWPGARPRPRVPGRAPRASSR